MSQPTAQANQPQPDTRAKQHFRGWTPLPSRLNPYLPPIFITLILLIGNLSFGILESYSKTLLAIVTAITFELVLGRIFLHKWPHPASAYITGISVGILLRSPAFWPYALCSALSITSKYALRVQGRHIWNPSNFGICAMLILASQAVASLSIQWGNNFASLVEKFLYAPDLLLFQDPTSLVKGLQSLGECVIGILETSGVDDEFGRRICDGVHFDVG